jgi:dienelactone hydrolase
LCSTVTSLLAAPKSVELPSWDRQGVLAIQLAAQWFAAPMRGDERYPAVLLLHGCGGLWNRARNRIDPRIQAMADRLNGMGFHALALDSLTPRGESEICTQKVGARAVTQRNRRLDALAALVWLAEQPGVDGRRLGMIGWSNGGSTVLAASNARRPEVRAAAVKASWVAAFYPGCESDLKSGYEATAPMLLLVGADDDWTPPKPCQDLAEASKGRPIEIEIETYAGAVHGFDGLAPVRLRKDVPNGVHPGQGVHVGGHAPSREAALQRLDSFIQHQGSRP